MVGTRFLALCTVIQGISAFPAVVDLDRRIKPIEHECNTGIICSKDFDEKKQFVSVDGKYEYRAPTIRQIRGPCPGLNAAANHGYLPRDGLATIEETITGLYDAFHMAVDLSSFLAVVAVALTGDYTTRTWSIGGPFPYDSLGGLLSQPQGISYSHNKYESDASVGRFDAFMNHGDAFSLNVSRFGDMYDFGPRYTLTNLRKHFNDVREWSVHNNPYFFFAPFAGLVAPAAHEFVINFMSNHSAEEPSGYLDGHMLKEFFGISGPRHNFKWNKGQERIPRNWYKRPGSNTYSAEKNLADTTLTARKYPSTFQFGGNMGKVNTFTGVDIGDLTGGVYNSQNLLKGNNLGCFFFQAFEAGLPDELSGLVKKAHPVVKMVKAASSPIIEKLNCPVLQEYNQGLFNDFPGYHYHPKAKHTNG